MSTESTETKKTAPAKPNIILFGPSGTGKSTSIRNLDPATTAILNTEQKALPFKGASRFAMNVMINGYNEFHKVLDKAMANDKVKTIIVESFTSLIEMIYIDAKKAYAEYKIWEYYADEITKILHKSKNTTKNIIFIAIDGVIEGGNGVEERYVAVQGKWRKQIEKEFVIALYSNAISDENGKMVHRFITNKQKGYENISCKSPFEMFPETVENDLAKVLTMIDAYYEEAPVEEPKKEEVPVVQ